MKNYSHILFVLALFALAPIRVFALGFTPTDGGLVVNLKDGERFLLSVWVDKNGNGKEEAGEEFFVGNYNRYTGGDYFTYAAGSFLKLMPQANGATIPSDMTIWQVDTAITRVDANNIAKSGKNKNYALGGVSYTMWNDGKTVRTNGKDLWKFFGDLTGDIRNDSICDVVFVIPTINPITSSFDPGKTLSGSRTDRGTPARTDQEADGRFNSKTGIGFAGMAYREVYWLEIPRFNGPVSYTNAAIVTFNTTKKAITWSAIKQSVASGRAGYAYAQESGKPHNSTARTVFRLYLLDRQFVKYPSYIFATDEQNFRKYRTTNDVNKIPGDSTTGKKTYSVDWMYPMYREGTSTIYKTDWMNVPTDDSTFYYVGKDNTYVNSTEEDVKKQLNPAANTTAVSLFKNIDTLRVYPLKNLVSAAGKPFPAPAGAYGKMVVDTTDTHQNLSVAFEPKGYFLKVSTGKNVRMKQDPSDPNIWMSEEMWTISDAYNLLSIKATLMTGSEFSETDPGADIEGWSVMQPGTVLKDQHGEPVLHKSGWARIHVNEADTNGNIVLYIADKTKWIHYDNNDFLGTQIPDQYPIAGENTLTVEASRLKPGYTFDGWNTKADGTGVTIMPNTVLTLNALPEDVEWIGDSVINLYAQAHYDGTYNVALSFIGGDGKRYFVNNPGLEAPRYAFARHYDDWTNVWQGEEDVDNANPNYVSTFELRHPSNEIKGWQAGMSEEDKLLKSNEFVLSPRQYMMYGYEDSLMLYENIGVGADEYMGLYYTAPNTLLQNDTWASLFTTTNTQTTTGWPDFRRPSIYPAKLKTERYVLETDKVNHPDSLTLMNSGSATPYVKYNSEKNQFDGEASEANATEFQISAIVVADAHYIIIPDTTDIWPDTITFGYHTNQQTREQIRSDLTGKQLLACMMVGADTTYFHPNPKKILTTPQELYLSSDFRLSQTFDFIHDARVTTVASDDRASMQETSNYWHNNILSGQSSPKDVMYNGNYIDVMDTFRITLSQGGVSKIKKYYGHWKNGAEGLHVNGNTRYRDIIVRTKTYHYEAEQSHLELTPEYPNYTFFPLANHERVLNFTLTKVTTQRLVDVDGNPVRVDTVRRKDVTDSLRLGPGACSFASPNPTPPEERKFAVVVATTLNDHITLKTTTQNESSNIVDTLIISTTANVGGQDYPVRARVPLDQTSLVGEELVWSVLHNGQRYFITTNGSDLIFRQYRLNNSILYKYGTSTHLQKGSKDATNSDIGYITPWKFSYPEGKTDQIILKTEDGINRYFCVRGDTTDVSDDDDVAHASALTYKYVTIHVNSNSNEEEVVKLKYADGKWLKFTYSGRPRLTLVEREEEASEFSWGYLNEEFNLTNNGTYPSHKEVTYGYQSDGAVTIQTRYKAYKQYSMLLDNTLTYLCRADETRIDSLVASDRKWKTDTAFALIPDARTFDGGAKTSGLYISARDKGALKTTIKPSSATNPTDVKIGGKYVNIVDTLRFRLSLKPGSPYYRFKGDWSWMKSVSDAEVKVPLIRKTYHDEPYDSLVCIAANDEGSYVFPNKLVTKADSLHTFTLSTTWRRGTYVKDADGNVVEIKDATETNLTGSMSLGSRELAQIRLVDEYNQTPDWCYVTTKAGNQITIRCTKDGARSPRLAYVYIVYIIMVDTDEDGTPEDMRFINYRITLTQPSLFDYANNQHLVHRKGASGDSLKGGMQQVHENRRILYYYPEEEVGLPVRERGFYGWWRWYREGKDANGVNVSDTDIPDSLWVKKPTNTAKYSFPFRTIGDSVKVPNPKYDPEDKESKEPDSIKQLVTMGRYTVFHYRSSDYGTKFEPPVKNPTVVSPDTFAGLKPTIIYAVDISNYYDGLPMSVKDKNQVDTARLDTMQAILEPTLSLREIFELHPWTEMATKLEGYKDTLASKKRNLKYMEDHVVMAPIGNRLLLSTEQRYDTANVRASGQVESMLGYYMRDDNWSTWAGNAVRQDSMIWCGGYDADCKWYTYDPKDSSYTRCYHKITQSDDFLEVPAKTNISSGFGFDTVYYCMRSQSKKTTGAGTKESPDVTVDGDYMFNICRYMIIYHDTLQYGPLKEKGTGSAAKAIITNDDITDRYEILQKLDFDYLQPGSSYHVYPHPLPWADVSYGYTYPETPDLPHNRYHAETDFPNFGEYGLVNKIPYSTWWYQMEQHGGAANGYMIYCDGMASSGQVAALSLDTVLCAGQKMFFSAYVGNPSNQKGKANPNFVFSVQGSSDGKSWEDVATYMTGDILPSDKWYQIYFPIVDVKAGMEDHRFRVRIYNMAATFDGNDFIIDDICIFATKPPLIGYQASTVCKEHGGETSDTHVILRLDYGGITGEGFNNDSVCYTIESRVKKGAKDSTYFVSMTHNYIHQRIVAGDGTVPDTIYGRIFIPARDYQPQDEDSIYTNMADFILRYDSTADKGEPVQEGYIYETLEGLIRPVKYIIHNADMSVDNDYIVRMAVAYRGLMSSICGMTSHLKITDRMILAIDGEEQPKMEVSGMCANATYELGLHVKGALYVDSVAPIELTGTCYNDWLLYGDTTDATSLARYGYKYSDIVKVVKDILRYEPAHGTNANQFASSMTAISRRVMNRIREEYGVTLSDGVDPYTLVKDLVDKGYLLLYKSTMTVTVRANDSVEYVILPIAGSGTDALHNAHVDVCTVPIYVKLCPKTDTKVPLILGADGINRKTTDADLPLVLLMDESQANGSDIYVKIDSIMTGVDGVAIDSIYLFSTDDPNYRPGVHSLRFEPDREYDYTGGSNEGYYKNNDSILLEPVTKNYHMLGGYKYTFVITLRARNGALVDTAGCSYGKVPFTISVVPAYLRWAPQSADNNQWNNPDNWIGVTKANVPIHEEAHFAPLSSTYVVIAPLDEGMPYPSLPNLAAPSTYDSIQEVGFMYNTCSRIRFLSGAAMAQQQRMQYDEAIVDMTTPNGKWAFRTSPVNGLISGDLYMSNADILYESNPWEVGEFDANGRNYSTGTGSFWLSLYNQTVHYQDFGGAYTERPENEDTQWSKVTNALTEPLPAGQGWAVYSRTPKGNDATIRLPKTDDIYYYYDQYGEKMYDLYQSGLQSLRSTLSDGREAGKLAFHPAGASEDYTLTNSNAKADTTFIFGNPTMGYIDIWRFLNDNTHLKQVIKTIDKDGVFTPVTKASAMDESNVISNAHRYLPPMQAIVLTRKEASSSLKVTLKTSRVVTEAVADPVPDPTPDPAPRRNAGPSLSKGIMHITATNAADERCTTRLLLGQGYNKAICDGEDALLTTINIEKYTVTGAPATPFNIYALEGQYGMSINLLDSIVNVPISFYMTENIISAFDPVTRLWFTGVNNIDGQLVLYDALTDTEKPIIDGICIDIETPQQNNLARYYIRRRGYSPSTGGETPTGVGVIGADEENAVKILQNGHVLIIREGHVYTMFGQKIR